MGQIVWRNLRSISVFGLGADMYMPDKVIDGNMLYVLWMMSLVKS